MVPVADRSSSRHNSKSPKPFYKESVPKISKGESSNVHGRADGTQSIGDRYFPHRMPESIPCSSAKGQTVEVPKVRGESAVRAASSAEFYPVTGSAPEVSAEYTDLGIVIRQQRTELDKNASPICAKEAHTGSTR